MPPRICLGDLRDEARTSIDARSSTASSNASARPSVGSQSSSRQDSCRRMQRRKATAWRGLCARSSMRILHNDADRRSSRPIIGWIEELVAQSRNPANLGAQDAPLVAIRYTPRADCFFCGRRPDCAPALGSRSRLQSGSQTGIPGRPRRRSIHSHAILKIEALSNAGLDVVKAIFRFVPDQVAIHEIAPTAEGRTSDSSACRNSVEHAGVGIGASSRMLRVDAKRIDRLARSRR